MEKPYNCADPLSGAKKYKLANKNYYTVRAKLMDRDYVYKDEDGKLKKGKKGTYLLEDLSKNQSSMDQETFKLLFQECK